MMKVTDETDKEFWTECDYVQGNFKNVRNSHSFGPRK
jgi:hypothetical protein